MRIHSVTKVYQFSGHKNCIYSLNYSLHADAFYSGGAEGYLVEWNHKTRQDGQLVANVNKAIYSICALPEQQQVLAGTAIGGIHVIDLKQKKETRHIEAHTLGVFCMLLHQNNLYTSGEDGMLHQWDPADFKLLHSVKVSNKSTRTIAISAQRNELATGSSDNKIRLYDLQTLELKQEIDAHTHSVFALAYSPDQTHLLSGGRDAHLHSYVCDDHYKQVQKIPAHLLHINQIRFNPSGNLLATCSMDKSIKIWAAQSLELLKVIDRVKSGGHISSVNALLWLDDHTLLSGSDDREIMLWEVR
ncbi:MAG: WD40 repeat domain-containing protein [Bacteroidia bacterium]|jgi:WD40 repeat protein